MYLVKSALKRQKVHQRTELSQIYRSCLCYVTVTFMDFSLRGISTLFSPIEFANSEIGTDRLWNTGDTLYLKIGFACRDFRHGSFVRTICSVIWDRDYLSDWLMSNAVTQRWLVHRAKRWLEPTDGRARRYLIIIPRRRVVVRGLARLND